MGTTLPYVVIVVAIAFWGWCLVDYTRTDPREMRTFEPVVWLVVLVLGSVAGGLAWAILGRPQPRA